MSKKEKVLAVLLMFLSVSCGAYEIHSSSVAITEADTVRWDDLLLQGTTFPQICPSYSTIQILPEFFDKGGRVKIISDKEGHEWHILKTSEGYEIRLSSYTNR